MHPAIAHIGIKKPVPYYDWMANEPNAVRSWEGPGITPATPTWIDKLGVRTLANMEGTPPVGSTSSFNGKPGLTGSIWGNMGSASATFADVLGGTAPRSFGVVVAVKPTAISALQAESTCYNNDTILMDQNFRWGMGLGLSVGIYYLVCWIYNGSAFKHALASIGASLPSNGFIGSMRYTTGAGANNLVSAVNDVEGTPTTVGTIDATTSYMYACGERPGFANAYLQGTIGQISTKVLMFGPVHLLLQFELI